MNYDNINYISSATIIAKIKQQLKSYFDSGALTEVLIPTYIDEALRKLRLLVYDRKDDVIVIENYRGQLPQDFAYLDEAYICEFLKITTNANFTTNSEWYRTVKCGDCIDRCVCDREVLDTVSVVSAKENILYKRGEMARVYYGSKNYCLDSTKSLKSTSNMELTIKDKTISANFENGSVYITYLSRPMDESGPLIPEIVEVEQFIEAWVTYNLFDQLWHSTTDESQNQINQKRMFYYQDRLSKFQSARNYLLLETKRQTRDSLYKQRRRLRKYNIYG